MKEWLEITIKLPPEVKRAFERARKEKELEVGRRISKEEFVRYILKEKLKEVV